MSKERLEELKKKTTGKDYLWVIEYAVEQAERVHELEEDNKNLQVLSSINRKEHMRIHEQNKRYRESIEHTKLKLKDFRRSANNTFKLIDPSNRVAKEEAFRLQCDIRDCLEVLDKKPDDRTVESPHGSWF